MDQHRSKSHYFLPACGVGGRYERTLILLLLAFYPELLTISYPSELRLLLVAHERPIQVLVAQNEQYNTVLFSIVGPDRTEMDGGVVRSMSDVISAAASINDANKVSNIFYPPIPVQIRMCVAWGQTCRLQPVAIHSASSSSRKTHILGRSRR